MYSAKQNKNRYHAEESKWVPCRPPAHERDDNRQRTAPEPPPSGPRSSRGDGGHVSTRYSFRTNYTTELIQQLGIRTYEERSDLFD